MSSRIIRVELGERSYPVVVGHGATKTLRTLLPASARRAVIVTQEGLPTIGDLDLPHTSLFIDRGEANKNLSTIERLCRGFADFGLTRNDVVIGVGGGLVTDVAGFAAASWHRGTSVVHVATSLLGMVDAAIGGKTAVNIPEGKNLVGAFWQPRREGGRRALLNYGHTLAHALEIAGEHDMAHGEAVAVGVVFAGRLAGALGLIDGNRVETHERVVGDTYGLRTRPLRSHDPAELVRIMRRDKKAIDGLTFILDGAGGLAVHNDVPEDVVVETLRTFLSE
ncbi:MAG: iron-containing alcohol dehydrogenase [Acidimicrobiia bacterium]|nr:iron-containing alcohol dehydrogenase [Acidimicrobiia bacterium]